MSLFHRVASLIRANLNDMVDKAEDPEKLLKQLLLDMQNQFMQLKTQTAIAIAEQHLLEAKRNENLNARSEWVGKAELALNHNDEHLARMAVAQSLTYENAATNFAQQLQDQTAQVGSLRDSLAQLEAKMEETRTKADLLMARHRRARLAVQTGQSAIVDVDPAISFDRVRQKVSEAEALGRGYAVVNQPGTNAQLERLEKQDKVENLLAELKRKQIGS